MSRLRDLSSFESCSASVSALQLARELLADRAFDRCQPLLLEQHLQAVAHLELADDVVLGRVERDRRCDLGEQLADDPLGLAEPNRLDPLPHRVAVGALELGVQLDIDPLRLADLAGQLIDDVADADDLAMSELEGLEHRLFRHLVGAGLDHRQRAARADDDQIERRVVELARRSD